MSTNELIANCSLLVKSEYFLVHWSTFFTVFWHFIDQTPNPFIQKLIHKYDNLEFEELRWSCCGCLLTFYGQLLDDLIQKIFDKWLPLHTQMSVFPPGFVEDLGCAYLAGGLGVLPQETVTFLQIIINNKKKMHFPRTFCVSLWDFASLCSRFVSLFVVGFASLFHIMLGCYFHGFCV